MTFRSAAVALVPILLLVGAFPSRAADDASPATGVTKIRIVRLSEVKGAVTMDRAIGRGFEPAIANMPIVENSSLRTGQGVAEVEFEDNSSLRLAPDTTVEFPELARLATGETASSVHLLRGIAYVSLVKSKSNQAFSLLFASQKLALEPGSHVRVDIDDARANVAVLDGSVRLEDSAGAQEIAHKKTLTFHLADQTQSVAKDVAAQPYDSWDQNAAGYHARTAAYSAMSSTPYTYGLNDMMYYGSFMNAGGCGTMWRPYFTSAAWDPFSNGTWALYSGAGYSWVSPYPWGWTPYHSGSWSFCPGAGWGWQPGGSWNGLNNTTSLIASGGPVRFQPPSKRILEPGESSLTPVNLKPVVRSEVASPESFIFRGDSAGLGIPRDELGKLDKFSRQAAERGTATTHIYMSGPIAIAAGGRAVNANSAIHRGVAPAPVSEAEASARGSSANSGSSASTANLPSGASNRSSGPAPTASSHPH